MIIGFSKPQNRCFPIGSWLIRFYQQTPYSHVYLKFYSNKLDRHIIYEAVGGGVRFIGNEMWQEHAKVVKEYDIQLNEDDHNNLMKFCIDRAGTKYSVCQNLGIFIANLFKWEENPFKNADRRSNCSEEVALILVKYGYKFNKSLDLVTPKDVYEVLV